MYDFFIPDYLLQVRHKLTCDCKLIVNQQNLIFLLHRMSQCNIFSSKPLRKESLIELDMFVDKPNSGEMFNFSRKLFPTNVSLIYILELNNTISVYQRFVVYFKFAKYCNLTLVFFLCDLVCNYQYTEGIAREIIFYFHLKKI